MTRKFILVVGEDIVVDMTMPDSNKFQGHINALLNNPRFIEIPIESEINQGWVWDGNNFNPPSI
jgi:hypothetical protein